MMLRAHPLTSSAARQQPHSDRICLVQNVQASSCKELLSTEEASNTVGKMYQEKRTNGQMWNGKARPLLLSSHLSFPSPFFPLLPSKNTEQTWRFVQLFLLWEQTLKCVPGLLIISLCPGSGKKP